jgi:branched-chain amino acid transport system substrate-binding protein
MKRWWMNVLVILTVLALGPAVTVSSAPSVVVKIGNLAPNTGVGAAFGETQTNGALLAVEEINAQGGIPGVGKIEMVTEDSGSTPTGAVNAANKLIQQHKVIAIVGEAMSGNTLAVVPVTARAGVSQLTAMSSAPTITQQGSPYIFRVQITAARSGIALGNYLAKDKGFKKIAIINDTNEFGTNYAASVEQALRANNAGPSTRQSYNTGDKDFSAQLLRVRDAGADAVVLSSQFVDGALILTQMRQLGIRIQTAGPDALANFRVIELAGAAADGLIFTNSYVDTVDDPKIKQFATKFEARFRKRSDNGAALSYDCVYILAKAIEKAKSTDLRLVRNAVAGVEYEGITGKIRFDKDGDALRDPIIFSIKGTGYVVLKR